MKRKHTSHKPRVLTQLCFGGCVDKYSALMAEFVDVDADREWFRRNPGKTVRRRLASPLELKSTGFAPGSLVTVTLLAPNLIFRDIAEAGPNIN